MLLGLLSIPLIGGIWTLLSNEKGKGSFHSKPIALITSIITFIWTLWIWLLFDNNVSSATGFQLVTYLSPYNWIMLGIDGISLYLILLTSL